MHIRFPGGAPATNPVPHVISKIESVEALVNFDSILEVQCKMFCVLYECSLVTNS